MIPVGTRIGRWRVIGQRADAAVVVDHLDPTLRYRLGRVAADATEAEMEPWLMVSSPVLAGRIDALDWGGDAYWVLDDVDAWPLSAIVHADQGTADLPLVAVVALDLLEALEDSDGTRWITPATVAIDRRGHTRLLPHFIGEPEVDAAPFVTRDQKEIYGLGVVLHWMLTARFAGGTPLRVLRPDVPEKICEAIQRAMLPDPVYRWQTPRSFKDAMASAFPPLRGARAQVRDRMSHFEPTVPTPWLAELSTPTQPVEAPEISLPAALEPWREALSMFPAELALGIGAAVRRFARVVGPLALESDARAGVPDGYNGVTRRGPFDRLLLSEWAIFLEIPEEFLRRAAMGEQLHHALAHKEPGGARRSFALFDAGPMSLGRPRVAQLAILIVLHARARAARVPFAWGVLQDQRRTQIAELNAASVIRLLQGRTEREVSAIDGAEWAISLGAPLVADDLWLVGPPGIEEKVALGGGTRVQLAERLEVGARIIDATIVRPGAVVRSVELELPPEVSAVRLLRNPFEARRAPERTALPGQLIAPLIMSSGGRRVVAMIDDGGANGVAVIALPRTPRENVALPILRMPAGRTEILTAVFENNRLHALERDEGHRLMLRRYGPHGGPSHEWRLNEVDQDAIDAIALRRPDLSIAFEGGRPAVVLIRSDDGTLWRWTDFEMVPTWNAAGVGVVGMVVQQHGAFCSVRKIGGEIDLVRWRGREPEAVHGRWRGDGDGAIVQGAGASSLPGAGVAVRVRPHQWIYGEGSSAKTLEADPHDDVVALGLVQGIIALVIRSDDKHAIAVGGRVVYKSDSAIVSIVPNPTWPSLACLDASGRVRVIDLSGQILFEAKR